MVSKVLVSEGEIVNISPKTMLKMFKLGEKDLVKKNYGDPFQRKVIKLNGDYYT